MDIPSLGLDPAPGCSWRKFPNKLWSWFQHSPSLQALPRPQAVPARQNSLSSHFSSLLFSQDSIQNSPFTSPLDLLPAPYKFSLPKVSMKRFFLWHFSLPILVPELDFPCLSHLLVLLSSRKWTLGKPLEFLASWNTIIPTFRLEKFLKNH